MGIKRTMKSTLRGSVNRRLWVLYVLIIVVFCILLGRLFYLQVIKGNYYSEKAASNTVRTVELPARRGDIYDRKGKVMASSEPYMCVKVYLEEVNKDEREELAARLVNLFNRKDIYEAEQAAREELNTTTLTSAIAEANEMTEDELQDSLGGNTDKEDENGEEGGESEEGTVSDNNVEDDEDVYAGSLAKNNVAKVDEILGILNSSFRSYQGVTVRTYTYDVGVKVAQIIAENKWQFPGVTVEEEPMRTYPNGYVAGHVIGTIGKITDKQYENLGDLYGYANDDVIGQSGLESFYERYTVDEKETGLRGTDGTRLVGVDADGNVLGTVSEEEPVAGNSLVTTIDLKVQKSMDKALEAVIKDCNSRYNKKCKAGSAVMLDVKTGGVLAMSSYPFVDPNDFAQGLSDKEYNYYFDAKLSPQINRAIASVYAVGSTFKIVTATAVLKQGLNPYTEVKCTEDNWVEPMASCWNVHGTVNFFSAMAGSCNTYFQIMARRVGEENMLDVARSYGFGQATNIDLPSEAAGLLPTPEWKAENFNGYDAKWHSYDTYYTSIGQGATQDTIIQLASYTAAIANKGERMQPYIVDQVVNDNGDVLYQHENTVAANLGLSDDKWKMIFQAMEGVIDDESGGTAGSLFKLLPKSLLIAGKTGTAQTGLVGDDPNHDYHGVFIAFAPANDPQVAFASLIEYGTHGGVSAGKVAEAAMYAYFGYDVDIGQIVL